MKTIDNYISERLNPRHLGPAAVFPVGASFARTRKFLIKAGFEEFQSPSHHLSEYPTIFNMENKKCFLINKNLGYIAFADTSKHHISESNPAYNINFIDRNNRPYRYRKISEENQSDIPTISPDEFKKDMMEYFR
jgi:hypothetical protein